MIRRLGISVFSLAVCTFAAESWTGGPYVVNVGPTTATVCWIGNVTEVKLGTDPEELTKSAKPDAQTGRFIDLSPNTAYYYDAVGLANGKGHFKTAPVGPASFTFLVYGDTRTRHDVHRKVMEAIEKVPDPDFVLQTGDLVENGTNEALWPIFFDIEKNLLRRTVYIPSLGNHERNCKLFYRFFDLKQPYHSFDWGAAHFIVMNSDLGNEEDKEAFWAEQTAWIEKDLSAHQDADFRFISCHHPPFTAYSKRQGQNKEMRALVPMFEKYKVTALFAGHDHNYQHHLNNGVHYIITGGGGAPLYPVDAPLRITLKAESTENYVQVKVDGKTVHVLATALDGHVIDKFDMK